jgi:hypothetical protein
MIAEKRERTAEAASGDTASSPSWASVMPTGPDNGVKITEGYARLVARTVS